MNNLYSKILSDAGWTLHKVEPELSSAYLAHQATGQIVYLEFYDEDDGADDRTWEAVEALITKKLKFDNFYRAMEF
jgi:hypothetical protein